MNDIIPAGHSEAMHLTDSDRYAELRAESIISSAVSFHELRHEFILFHVGLLCCCPGMDDDPVQMYMAHVPGNPAIGVVHTTNPMFHGSSELTKAMWFCARKDWTGLKQFLGTFSLVDPVRKTGFTTFWHSIEMPDMRALESGRWDAKTEIPQIQVEIIGLAGHNHQRFYTSAEKKPFSKPVYHSQVLNPEQGAPVVALIKGSIDDMWGPLHAPPIEAPVAPVPTNPMSTQELINAWRREFNQ